MYKHTCTHHTHTYISQGKSLEWERVVERNLVFLITSSESVNHCNESERFPVQSTLLHVFSEKMFLCIWSFSGDILKILSKKHWGGFRLGVLYCFSFRFQDSCNLYSKRNTFGVSYVWNNNIKKCFLHFFSKNWWLSVSHWNCCLDIWSTEETETTGIKGCSPMLNQYKNPSSINRKQQGLRIHIHIEWVTKKSWSWFSCRNTGTI